MPIIVVVKSCFSASGDRNACVRGIVSCLFHSFQKQSPEVRHVDLEIL